MNFKKNEARIKATLREAAHQDVPNGLVHAVVVLGATVVMTAMVLLKAKRFSWRR